MVSWLHADCVWGLGSCLAGSWQLPHVLGKARAGPARPGGVRPPAVFLCDGCAQGPAQDPGPMPAPWEMPAWRMRVLSRLPTWSRAPESPGNRPGPCPRELSSEGAFAPPDLGRTWGRCQVIAVHLPSQLRAVVSQLLWPALSQPEGWEPPTHRCPAQQPHCTLGVCGGGLVPCTLRALDPRGASTGLHVLLPPGVQWQACCSRQSRPRPHAACVSPSS